MYIYIYIFTVYIISWFLWLNFIRKIYHGNWSPTDFLMERKNEACPACSILRQILVGSNQYCHDGHPGHVGWLSCLDFDLIGFGFAFVNWIIGLLCMSNYIRFWCVCLFVHSQWVLNYLKTQLPWSPFAPFALRSKRRNGTKSFNCSKPSRTRSWRLLKTSSRWKLSLGTVAIPSPQKPQFGIGSICSFWGKGI